MQKQQYPKSQREITRLASKEKGSHTGSGWRGSLSLFIIILFSFALPIHALTIKLGSLVPQGSPWERSIRMLASEWTKISDGKVILRVYTNGIAGDEGDMIRKMRFGQLQAAGLSMSGLSQIFGDILVPAIPMLVENEEEFKYLFDRMIPYFQGELEKRGFKILFWNFAGWAYLFSRHPVVYPADLIPQKLWIAEGNTEEVNAWKSLGFKPVTFSTMDLMVQLQTGGVEAFVTSPLIAASNQWFGIAKNMSGFRWNPFFGAFIITSNTWNKIPARMRCEILEAAKRCGVEMEQAAIQSIEDAVEVMQKYGLVIGDYPEDAKRAWIQYMEKAVQLLIKEKFSAECYLRAKSYLDEYRKSQ